MKSDILDFLDKKFAKTVKKKSKKKKEKTEVKQAPEPKVGNTSIYDAINEADKGQNITGDTLYHELVKEDDLP